jgi:transcriptional regulator with XRE-family HTH domain
LTCYHLADRLKSINERRPTLNRTFGEVFREARKRAGKTMQDVASYIGVTVPYISDVENDNRSPLVSERIVKAAELFGIDPLILLESAAKTRNSCDLDLTGASDKRIQVGAALQRGWPELSDGDLDRIDDIIRNRK